MQEPKEPFQESSLESAEYRERLMRKLNCLIAVLEVARAKVKKSLAGPAPDVDRLKRIQSNLTSTLEVCRRARKALERREALPENLPENLAEIVRQQGQHAQIKKRAPHMPKGARQEMSSAQEHARFTSMGKISKTEIDDCDLDDLTQKLFE
jgi:hypothetical protein